MNIRKLLDWRKLLIYSHRWLGISIGLMFVVWFISGLILMYYGMPHLTAGERLMRMSPLDASKVGVTPAQAAEGAGLTDRKAPTRVRVAMLGDRPVYRFNYGSSFGTWVVVYADTGEPMARMNAEDAAAFIGGFLPEQSTIKYAEYLEKPDNFVMYPAMQPHLPMHRFELGDVAGTEYYVSEKSGEAVMKTSTMGRFLGFSGYVLHRLFWWRQQTWWQTMLIWLSWIGIIMSATGLIVGIWRYGLTPRFRHKGVHSHSPYKGWMKWHHYAGLIFGLFTFTWMFSGAIAVSGIPGIGDSGLTGDQREAVTGGDLNLEPLTVEGLQGAVAAISPSFPVKEVELFQFAGKPYFVAYQAPSPYEVDEWSTRSVTDFISPTIDHHHLMVSAVGPDQQAFARFPNEGLLEMAVAAMPDVRMKDATWMNEPDSYYYPTLASFDLGIIKDVRTLPVLRVRFDDPQETALYLNPSHGQMVKYDNNDRVNRWAYYGLHGLDFGFMWRRRPVWDVATLALMLGGTLLSVTTLVPMYRRLKRHGYRVTSLIPGRRRSAPVPSPQVTMKGNLGD